MKYLVVDGPLEGEWIEVETEPGTTAPKAFYFLEDDEREAASFFSTNRVVRIYQPSRIAYRSGSRVDWIFALSRDSVDAYCDRINLRYDKCSREDRLMPAFILKLDREHDEYITWSTVVDAPTAYIVSKEQARKEFPKLYPHWADKIDELLDRAERTGSSLNSRMGNASHVEGEWDDSDGFMVVEVDAVDAFSMLRRPNLRDFVHAWQENDAEKLRSLVEPPDPI